MSGSQCAGLNPVRRRTDYNVIYDLQVPPILCPRIGLKTCRIHFALSKSTSSNNLNGFVECIYILHSTRQFLKKRF